PASAVQCWAKPAVVHDFDGDGVADLATGTCSDYSAYSIGATAVPRWTDAVSDPSGIATATAFDFLGDGTAEGISGGEHQSYAFDGKTGELTFSYARNSGTLIEYPVVVDVDNDGSAEVVFPSNYPQLTWGDSPPDAMAGVSVTALHDAQERWIPARRIWN